MTDLAGAAAPAAQDGGVPGGRAARVVAVVVNYNAADYLVGCVRSLLAEGVADVVVVDNASSDGSERALADTGMPARFLGTGRNRGYGGGANFGIAASGSELVLVCNADIEVRPGAVEALAAVLDAEPDIGIVGPGIVDPDNTLYPSARSFPALGDAVGHAFLGLVAPRNRWSARYKMLGWDHARRADVDWVSGACFLARRDVLDRLAGFDESYFMYSEDVDLCWRAWKAGWRVAYEPAATVEHAQGASADQHPYRMILAHHRSLMRFANRTTRGRRRALLPLVGAGLVLRTVLAWVQRAAAGR